MREGKGKGEGEGKGEEGEGGREDALTKVTDPKELKRGEDELSNIHLQLGEMAKQLENIMKIVQGFSSSPFLC